MARRLLNIVPSPEQILMLTRDELSRALLEDMQAREQDPIGGKALRDSLGAAVVTPANFNSSSQNPRELQLRLDRAGIDAYSLLEQCALIEPDQGMNGRKGYVILTPKGRRTTTLVDFERVRARGLLKQEMLHSALRTKVYNDFAADELDSAVLEAFKIVEIAVREAAGLPEKEHGKALMGRAFALGGPLSLAADTKADSEALAGLFVGALNRFRNPGAHAKRTFVDVLEAMEELMFASRLLRLVDERTK